MSDLISRKALIENIWSLFNNTYNDASRFETEETELAKRVLSDVQKKIEAQPNDYDIDKVVDELRTKSDNAMDWWEGKTGCEGKLEEACAYSDAIVIVQSGWREGVLNE